MGVTNSFMALARKESKKSDHAFPMGAVIVGKRPLGRGHNMTKTHPKYANPEIHVSTSIHAEIACLIDCSLSNGDTIYVYREDKVGWPAMARPCINCQNELRKRGIKHMIYSIAHPPYYCVEDICP